PTAGGPYWWSAKLGSPAWSWFTGWFNMIGLVGIVAGVGYGAAIFLNTVLSVYGVTIGSINFATANTSAILHHQFVLFLIILFFWLYVLPLGFILTMYTQTGYDASAHTAEETRGAALGAAKGVWKSIFYSALLGWFLLLAFLFAATDTKAVNGSAGFVATIFTSAMANHLWGAKLILIIATVGQLFCGAAGLTSASRTWYAFSRDRGMPGWWLFRRFNQQRV